MGFVYGYGLLPDGHRGRKLPLTVLDLGQPIQSRYRVRGQSQGSLVGGLCPFVLAQAQIDSPQMNVGQRHVGG